MVSYAEWRNFGYVSRLSEVLINGSGGVNKQLDTTNALTRQQMDVSSAQQQREAENYSQMKQLMQPLIIRDQAIIGGDKSAAMAAAMPVISQITKGYNAARAPVMNMTGPGRGYALTKLAMDKDAAVAGARADIARQAPVELAGIGSGLGQFSLQELGAALSGLQGAGTTNKTAVDAEVAKRKAWFDFFGDIASAAGTAAGGYMSKCWIAEEIYGPKDERTHLLRAWLNGPFCQTRTGRMIMWMYGVLGHQIAWLTRRSRFVRSVLKPLFDRALFRATQYALGPR